MKNSEIQPDIEMLPKYAMQKKKPICIDCILYKQNIPLKDTLIYVDILSFDVSKNWEGIISGGTYNGCKIYGKGFNISKIDPKSGVNGRYLFIKDEEKTIPSSSSYSFEEYKEEVTLQEKARAEKSLKNDLNYYKLTSQDIDLFKLLLEFEHLDGGEVLHPKWKRMASLGLAEVEWSYINTIAHYKVRKPKNWMLFCNLLEIEV